jgi:hypothetical protein
MTEEEKQELAKKITEEAVQQLIDHIRFAYAPDSTIDPSSDGVPKTKAVAAALAPLQKTNVVIPITTSTKPVSGRPETEDMFRIPANCLYNYTISGVGTFKAVDLMVVPKTYDYGAPLSSGEIITLIAATGDGDMRKYTNRRLVWLYSMGSPIISYRDRLGVYERDMSFIYNSSNSTWELYIGTLKRTVVKNGGEVYQSDINDDQHVPQDSTIDNTTISQIIVLKRGV